ncbi:hypothetical protein OQX61_00495 [Pedobacter sp. PLR]|uniref:hypothetical protein n=1 Tax=Pedobacter sp. PLR TaxID=2994465 RepID=UPI002245D82D|nr:hypothetical protein [Pedobacter sp. PLR]MCX2449732.1 hypothetical protein [Pedobacter sp. PLR]
MKSSIYFLAAPTPSTTTIGSTNYIVTQTDGCLSLPAIITVIITAGPSAAITYSGSPYRSDMATATVTRTGTAGGTYSSTTGLSINPISGCNVYWKVEGAITGASTVMAGGTLKGRLFSTLGAIAIDGLSATIAMCSLETTWTGSTTTTNMTVPAGVPRYPLLNTGTGAVKNVTVQSNASLTITGGTLEITG